MRVAGTRLAGYPAGRQGWRVVLVALVFGSMMATASAATTQSLNPELEQNRNQSTQRYYQQRQGPSKPTVESNPIINSSQGGAKRTQSGQAQGPRFVLHGVRFGKSHFLKPATLQGLVRPYLGKRVTVATLRKIVGEVNKLYTKRGIYTARAVLPAQRIKGGIVRVELIEGRLGRLVIKGNHYTSNRFIRRRISLKSGGVVEGDTLARDLIFFNRTSDIHLRALLRPGASKGLTRILLMTQEPSRFHLAPFVDDAGSQSTGRYRGGLSFGMNGLLGMDDRLNGYVVGSQGAIDGFLSYSLPVNTSNGRVSVSYSRDAIDIVNGPYSQLNITGQSSSQTLSFVQPFIATQHWLLKWASSIAHSRSYTDAQNTSIANTHTETLSTGVTLQRNTKHHQWAVTQTVSAIHSQETLSNKHYFATYGGNVSYLQAFGKTHWSVLVNLGGQYSPAKQLPDTALFQIGGVSSVRGYVPGVVAGNSGFYGQFELHRALRPWLDSYAFVDEGAVYQSYPHHVTITSVGVGSSWRVGHWLTGSVDVGFPLKKVTPSQAGYRIDFRLTGHWGG